mmetsp:Transcript_17749/g.35008  ORF Transcript_17749/g.35008 Transcript_17749/m.35008 type:complete len:433 (+) Transcript_17749:44-1342(+)|eukprot:CAMPEP_0171513048 /NCGR_PEP_ID=MMETSP0959-20130129/1981_1 /TAXON_ID=87120 /ORGANISM="Aurantiochytrium limacinum, Strain ATCCMYA-1381" /LENGTH=432 /DNA_ID=CAMNT_0012051037 /DNA_START=31 /DNA_END=1329 /DNA_ORIENTATION=-
MDTAVSSLPSEEQGKDPQPKICLVSSAKEDAEKMSSVTLTSPTKAVAPTPSSGDAENKKLTGFLRGLGLDPEWYAKETEASKSLSRFIRINPCQSSVENILKSKVFASAKVVKGCEDFISCNGDIRLKGVPEYEDGSIYGMDLASGLAVHVLDVKPGSSVLDLCAAPGAKMCMLADVMKRQGLLIGVDASAHRVRTCASLLKKYRVAEKQPGWQCILVEDDGVTFSGPKAESVIWDTEADEIISRDTKAGSKRKRFNKSARQILARRRLETGLYTKSSTERRFDRVLVDAECTHDGSIKHMLKYSEGGVFGESALEDKFIDADLVKGNSGATSLQELQQGLLLNGFRLLAPGGILVYSTCSFSEAQNENIVKWLLDHPDYKDQVILHEGLESSPLFANAPPIPSQSLPGTLRFTPTKSRTSGLFIAKLSKRT